MPVSLDDLKKISFRVKILILCGLYLLVGYFYYFFVLSSSLDERSTLLAKKAELDQKVTEQSAIAAQKGNYIRDIKLIKQNFQLALEKLPDKKEIPGLFLNVSEAGKSLGIQFVLFQPMAVQKPAAMQKDQKAAAQKPPDKKEEDKKTGDQKKPGQPDTGAQESFYEEIPVKVTVTAGFHSIAQFFEKIGKLPRIINVEDITIGDAKDTKGTGRTLTTSCIIKTYMFREKAAANVK